jgi:hypothetical protein
MPGRFIGRGHRRVDVERHVQAAQVDRSGQAFGLVVGLGADGECADDDARPGALFRGLEVLPIGPRHLVAAARIDEVGEGEGQAQLGGKRAAVIRGAEQPDLRHGVDLGLQAHPLFFRKCSFKMRDELPHLLREVRGVGKRSAPHGLRGAGIAARRAAYAKVDATRG